MAVFPNSTLFFFFSLTLILTLIPNSALQSATIIPNFDSEIALYGDAKLVDGDGDGSARVTLTQPSSPSWGLLLRRMPFSLQDPNRPGNGTSFSMEFSFSTLISGDDVDWLELVLIPADSGPDLSGTLGFPVNGYFVTYVSPMVTGLEVRNGEKLKSWIDYNASSMKLEVRFAKFGDPRPQNPVVAYPKDLSSVFGGKDVLVGITSSPPLRSSSGVTTLYSWNFRLENSPTPNSIHSLPADPRGYKQQSNDDHKWRLSPLAVIGGLIFATVCGALMAFAVLFLWAVVAANKHTVSPGDQSPSDVESKGFRYEKIGVLVEKDSGDDVKN